MVDMLPYALAKDPKKNRQHKIPRLRLGMTVKGDNSALIAAGVIATPSLLPCHSKLPLCHSERSEEST